MTIAASSPVMIGRTAELGLLRAAAAAAAAGSARTVVIGGEAGIGKSRLIDEFLAESTDVFRVLLGQCVDLGSVASPYAPIKGILRTLADDVGAERMLDVAGPGRAALAALLPELGPAVADVDTPAVRGQLHEVVAVLLEAFSRERPIIVAVEDLHWIDSASLSLLRFLVRALVTGRVLLVLSYRTEDVTRGHPVRAFLSEVERSRSVERLEVTRLTRAQVRRQVRAISGEAPTDAAVETFFARSDGIPFFVEELWGIDAFSAGARLPDTLRDLLLVRYERLSEPARGLLRLLSTGGVRLSHALLSAVFTGTADELDAAARESVIAGVLVIDGDDYAFRHALVREAVLDDLLPGERTRYHARYAEAYERLAGRRRVAAEVAYHWLGAHDDVRAFPATIAAMRQARETYAYATAAQMGERAMELWDRVTDAEALAGMDRYELIGRTASYLRNAGEGDRALAVAKLGLAECPPDNRHYARLLRDAALYLSALGRPGAIAQLETALRLVDPDDDVLRMTIMSALAGRMMIEGRLDESIEVADRAHAMAVAADMVGYASVTANIGAVSRTHRGQIADGLAGLALARELAEHEVNAQLRYWVNASDIAFLLGDFPEAIRLAEEGLERARRYGVERSSGVILASNAVDPLHAIGEWDRADSLLERAIALDPPVVFQVYLQRARIWSNLWRGRVEEAAADLRRYRPMMAPFSEVEVQTRLGIARVAAEVALAQHDHAAAADELRVIWTEPGMPLPSYALPLLWNAARLLAVAPELSAGTEDDLRRLLDALTPWPTQSVWSAFIEAELGGGDGTDVALWRRASEATAASVAPVFLRSYALLQLARAELAGGDRATARSAFQDAVAQAEADGVTWVAEEASRLTTAAGLRITPTDPAPTGDADALTARERQVLDLIAEGLSNREIGARLFISGKTASVHVSAILRKLGASSRTEAAVRARG
ncbi:MAG: AAA family ATPase [Leifsonia sp.]